VKPIPFSQANVQLGAPHGMEAECGLLPVFTDGAQCISCWEPTPEERAQIANGAHIWLHVFSGSSQPPVALVVQTGDSEQKALTA
jgi:hypothetical protein